MQKTRFRNLGTTALHLAYVAKGSFVGTLCTVSKIWDIAAGAIIIKNAGGILTDIKGNEVFPIDMAACTDQNFMILASNKKNHEELKEILK